MAKSNELGVTPQGEDFSAWYNEVVLKAELADRGPVKGSIVIRPYGYRIWELLQARLDQLFKDTGHENAYFPLLIPMSYLQREAEHVQGFSPELAVITHGGGKKLEEPLVIRPTSETVIGEMFSRWISSYRDLPILINQWANVVRWEMRPRLFLRTTEFLWQEGHTAHANEPQAMRETEQMLDIYAQVAHEMMALPVVAGEKTAGERFPGALRTYTVEAMMRDGRALQCGTSHYLGTNFAKAFDISFQGEDGELSHCHTTSWGVSTRLIGAVILAHGDDRGLVLPPRLAPYQVVIVPIGRGEEVSDVKKAAKEISATLIAAGVRVHIDDRDASPGFKFNDWELRGVPLRLEIGPRDLASNSVVLSQRVGQDNKINLLIEDLVKDIPKRLRAYHDVLVKRAAQFRDERSAQADDWTEFTTQIATGFAYSFHCGRPECEDDIKADTAATPRCIPNSGALEKGKCIRCGEPSGYDRRLVFGRAY